LGGLLILILGILYIAFEKSLLVPAAPTKDGVNSAKADSLSRSILGVQVGLIALAMLVTRSSVASLQAKRGLPLGTQVVGWITLGKRLFSSSSPSSSTFASCPLPHRLYTGFNRALLRCFSTSRM